VTTFKLNGQRDTLSYLFDKCQLHLPTLWNTSVRLIIYVTNKKETEYTDYRSKQIQPFNYWTRVFIHHKQRVLKAHNVNIDGKIKTILTLVLGG
jgi:hypothetical protein